MKLSADVALLVSDAHQHEGIGTSLLEHLASVARHHGIRRFRADVLGENFAMLRVLRDLGVRVTSTPDLEVIEVDLDLDPGPQLLEATDRRESSADIASMQPLLAPKSIAVIGAGARASSVGHQVLRNIIDGGFTGSLHVVNTRRDLVLGIAAVPAPTDLPTAPDLAIIAVPASELLGVVRDCGERGRATGGHDGRDARYRTGPVRPAGSEWTKVGNHRQLGRPGDSRRRRGRGSRVVSRNAAGEHDRAIAARSAGRGIGGQPNRSAGAQPEQIAAALAIVVAAEEVDMVLAVFTETLVADVEFVMAAVTGAAAMSDKPIVATQVGREARSLPVPDTARAVPVFSFPEPAAAALGRALKYAVIRARPPKTKPCHSFDVEGARNLVTERLADGHEWLAPEDVARLLIGFGVAIAPQRVVSTAEAAVRAASEIGYPVVVKVVGGPVHKSDTGGVRLNVGTDRELAEAFVAVTSNGTQLKALIQPMIGHGIEMIVGCVQDAQFGPVVMVGAGGVLADPVADRTFRLAPIDVGEAEQMIDGLRTSRLLDGYRGMPAVSRPALADLVSRLAALADDLPEVSEIDLNPVICTGDQLIVVDARVRLARAPERSDPMLRQLRPIQH